MKECRCRYYLSNMLNVEKQLPPKIPHRMTISPNAHLILIRLLESQKLNASSGD
jgi:hypothetical protein